MPFGGYRQSGCGRELGEAGLAQYSEIKVGGCSTEGRVEGGDQIEATLGQMWNGIWAGGIVRGDLFSQSRRWVDRAYPNSAHRLIVA